MAIDLAHTAPPLHGAEGPSERAAMAPRSRVIPAKWLRYSAGVMPVWRLNSDRKKAATEFAVLPKTTIMTLIMVENDKPSK
jgi:hypothetical protein